MTGNNLEKLYTKAKEANDEEMGYALSLLNEAFNALEYARFGLQTNQLSQAQSFKLSQVASKIRKWK